MPEKIPEKDNNTNDQIKYENNNIYRKIIVPDNISLVDCNYGYNNS